MKGDARFKPVHIATENEQNPHATPVDSLTRQDFSKYHQCQVAALASNMITLRSVLRLPEATRAIVAAL